MLHTELSKLDKEELLLLSDKIFFIERERDIDLTDEMKRFAEKVSSARQKMIFSKEKVIFLKLSKLAGWENRTSDAQWKAFLGNVREMLWKKARVTNHFDGILVMNVNGIETLEEAMFDELIEFIEEQREHSTVVLTCLKDEESVFGCEEIRQKLWKKLAIYEVSINASEQKELMPVLWDEIPDLERRLGRSVKEALTEYVNSLEASEVQAEEFRYLINMLFPCQVISDKTELERRVMEIIEKNRKRCGRKSKVTLGFSM